MTAQRALFKRNERPGATGRSFESLTRVSFALSVTIRPSVSPALHMFKTLNTYWRSHSMPSPAALAVVSVAGAFIALGLTCDPGERKSS
jgi:hypothetical protein